MLSFTVLIEKEGDIYVAKNLELGIFSQGKSSEDAIKNLKEATELYLEDEPKDTLLSKLKDKQYSLTMLNI